MKYNYKKIILSTVFAGACLVKAYAGNPQRAGSAGASELLINPWARSAGWSSVNIAGVSGVESTFLNIAGLTGIRKTEVNFSNTQWLIGSDININAAGLAQKVGANGALSLNFVSFDYGEWERTTVDNPEGGLGTINPSAVNIGLGYSQKFIESISGGIQLKLYSQTIDNMSVSLLCVDAGIQYVTGDREELKFGITLKNVGSSASYSGDGQSVTLPVPQNGYSQAYQERSSAFELPATLAIGASYDFEFDSQMLTLAGAFVSNSFEKDQYTLGAEYSMRDILKARAGYTFYDNRLYEAKTTVFSGLSAGLSVDVPLGSSSFVLDYSYRHTTVFNGVHSIGVGVKL